MWLCTFDRAQDFILKLYSKRPQTFFFFWFLMRFFQMMFSLFLLLLSCILYFQSISFVRCSFIFCKWMEWCGSAWSALSWTTFGNGLLNWKYLNRFFCMLVTIPFCSLTIKFDASKNREYCGKMNFKSFTKEQMSQANEFAKVAVPIYPLQ